MIDCICMRGDDSSAGGRHHFATTRWSLVLAAGREEGASAQAALDHLCRVYWFPLYAFARRQGCGPDDAQDLTQSFLARLIEKRDLAGVAPARGRFRSFLLAAMKHFLLNAWDRERAGKRGGGRHNFTSLDARTGEERYQLEPADPLSADRLFERSWALALLDEVLARLRAEQEQAGKLALFDALKPALTGDDTARHADLGLRLGLSEGAVKVAVHRLRRRYRELLREEIAATVEEPGEVEDELRHLFSVLSH